jgi:hypothetical protein
METKVKSPRDIFFLPQRLAVPLFQRPYVWTEERQWDPLWSDVQRIVRRIESGELNPTHFLGAVVLQNQQVVAGEMPVRTVIDGQQRLTTLQLLLDSVHFVLVELGFETVAQQLADLIENPAHFCQIDEEKFKVWPTNKDRPAFNEVMSATQSLDYAALRFTESRMPQAHRFFTNKARELFETDPSITRAHNLVAALSTQLQLVVIELAPDEDAQEIFETLNARGTPLTAADLIKNFIFQSLPQNPVELETAYTRYWVEFETPFWESDVAYGRNKISRSSLFLTHWLIAEVADDIYSYAVFSEFKNFVTESKKPMLQILEEINLAAIAYRRILEQAANPTSTLDVLEMFAYRISVMDQDAIRPLLVWTCDPNRGEIPQKQISKITKSLESWLVRRTLLRLPTKLYNRITVDLLKKLNGSPRKEAGDTAESFFASLDAVSTYWPDDFEIRAAMTAAPIYRQLSKGKLRLILEAMEDFRRRQGGKNLHEQPQITRSTCTIEHIMPQSWQENWPLDDDDDDGAERDLAIQTLGNLTLVTKALNSKLSNSAWLGVDGKREALTEHSSIKITQDVTSANADKWDEERIASRSETLIDALLAIWPVPENHSTVQVVSKERVRARKTVWVSDLIAEGLLTSGQQLFARTAENQGVPAELLDNGSFYIAGVIYETPSAAAEAVHGRPTNGWWYWVTDLETKTSLDDLRKQLIAEEEVE